MAEDKKPADINNQGQTPPQPQPKPMPSEVPGISQIGTDRITAGYEGRNTITRPFRGPSIRRKSDD